MQFLQLLGRQLKDDSIMEILELHDIDVIYEFDRCHEGIEDIYWAEFRKDGFLFRFNESQKLVVVYLYITANEGFTPISNSKIDVPVYDSFIVAKSAFEKEGLEYKEGSIDNSSQTWIKSSHSSHESHYEFKDKKLQKITLMFTQ